MRAAKGLLLDLVGWALVVAGLAALVLPGPGLLMLFAGVAVLSQRYHWAHRMVTPLRYHALKGAADSVRSWFRIVLTLLVALVLITSGVIWVVGPAVPAWWPLNRFWWLPGDEAAGVTQIVSGLIAGGLLGWSIRHFRGDPERRRAFEEEWRAFRQRHRRGNRRDDAA